MASNNGTVTTPPTDQPSSSPVDLPSSTPPPSPSSNPPTTPPSSSQRPSPSPSSPPSSPPPRETRTTTAPSIPPSTEIITSIVTPTPTAGESVAPSTVIITSIVSNPNNERPTLSSETNSASSSSTSFATQPNKQKPSSTGLSAGGKTAIAVVIPVVVVALLLLAGIFFWRKRKQRKNAEEARRKEVEEYGFNPNNDPTLPAVGLAGSEMAEDQSGYRGWGNATSSSNRKASTTLTSGMTGYSDNGSNPGGYQSPNSPTDVQSNDPLVAGRRETLDSDGVAALGTGPAAGQNASNIHRGPSNASSSYSAGNRSDNSGDYPIPANNPHDYYANDGYYQPNPYDNGYGGGQQPVIRDVSARRNTRIENPSVFPQQGNSGIAQNF